VYYNTVVSSLSNVQVVTKIGFRSELCARGGDRNVRATEGVFNRICITDVVSYAQFVVCDGGASKNVRLVAILCLHLVLRLLVARLCLSYLLQVVLNCIKSLLARLEAPDNNSDGYYNEDYSDNDRHDHHDIRCCLVFHSNFSLLFDNDCYDLSASLRFVIFDDNS